MATDAQIKRACWMIDSQCRDVGQTFYRGVDITELPYDKLVKLAGYLAMRMCTEEEMGDRFDD